jgi:hypothetical protein
MWIRYMPLLLLVACGDDSNRGDAVDGGAEVDTVEPDSNQVDTVEADSNQDDTVEADSNQDDTAAPDTATGDTLSGDTGMGDTTDTSVSDVDTAPTCDESPRPFVGPSEPEAWNHFGSNLTSSLGNANHRGQDVIVQVGRPQVLVAKFAYAFIDKDITCEDVDIWVQREVPCGEWERLGTARTTDNPDDSLDCDNYGDRYGIEDDGGRVFFEIPEDKRLAVGRYPIRMVLRGDLSQAAFDLIVVEAGTQAVLTDVDGTLTTSDTELFTEVILSIFNGTYEQEMYVDADHMLKTWSDKGYLIIYMSGRPDLLRTMSERWIEARFPPGPIHLTDTNGQVLPTNDGVGTYKKEFIAYLRSQGIDIVAAYGNATTDIWAYGQSNIPKEVTFIIGDHAGEEGTQALSGSYTPHLTFPSAFSAATSPAPPARFGWW